VKVIILSKKYGNCRSFNLGIWSGAILSACLACLIGVPTAAYITYSKLVSDSENQLLEPEIRQAWAERMQEQEQLLVQTRQEAENKLAALTLRVAELQARLVRIDALGERLTSMVNSISVSHRHWGDLNWSPQEKASPHLNLPLL
jgi:RecA/RadA recombinase